MNNLQRYFKVGLYYPNGHTVADQAAAYFLHSLNEIAGKDDIFVRFTVDESTLSIMDIEADSSLFSVQHFHDLLHSLGISTLEIHRDITPDELRLFLSRLIFLRTNVQRTRHFQEIEITGMPETIKIHQLKFLASDSASNKVGSGDCSQPTIDYLLSSLVQHGYREEQVSVCRQLLESIPNTLSKRPIAESDLPSVTWDDVEKLLRRVAESIQSPSKASQTHHLDKSQNVDTLVAILKSMEKATGGTRSRDAVNMLVKILKESQPQPKDDKEKTSSPTSNHNIHNDPPGLTISELHRSLFPLKKLTIPPNLGENNRSEDLSILMQMLNRDRRLFATLRMQEELRGCLRAPLDEKEWQVFIKGMQQLIKTKNRERLEAVFLIILDILRRSEHTTPLIFLRDIVQGITKKEFVTCWPFLVNEAFIAGPQDEPEIFSEICTMIGLISQEDMHRNLPRIEKLEALRERCIAAAMFSPPPASLNALFVLLLNSSQAKYINEQLVSGLKLQHLGWLDKALGPLLDDAMPSHQQFIIDLLQQRDPNQPSRSLKKNGASIIVDKLPAISPEQRKEEWVPHTIGALAKAQIPGVRKMLKHIMKSTHYLIIPDWPRATRNAAQEVLKGMNRFGKNI